MFVITRKLTLLESESFEGRGCGSFAVITNTVERFSDTIQLSPRRRQALRLFLFLSSRCLGRDKAGYRKLAAATGNFCETKPAAEKPNEI
jgi:hypothetical protein